MARGLESWHGDVLKCDLSNWRKLFFIMCLAIGLTGRAAIVEAAPEQPMSGEESAASVHLQNSGERAAVSSEIEANQQIISHQIESESAKAQSDESTKQSEATNRAGAQPFNLGFDGPRMYRLWVSGMRSYSSASQLDPKAKQFTVDLCKQFSVDGLDGLRNVVCEGILNRWTLDVQDDRESAKMALRWLNRLIQRYPELAYHNLIPDLPQFRKMTEKASPIHKGSALPDSEGASLDNENRYIYLNSYGYAGRNITFVDSEVGNAGDRRNSAKRMDDSHPLTRKKRYRQYDYPYWLIDPVFPDIIPGGVGGPVHVKGYYKKNGTYVNPHTRSLPSRH